MGGCQRTGVLADKPQVLARVSAENARRGLGDILLQEEKDADCHRMQQVEAMLHVVVLHVLHVGPNALAAEHTRHCAEKAQPASGRVVGQPKAWDRVTWRTRAAAAAHQKPSMREHIMCPISCQRPLAMRTLR